MKINEKIRFLRVSNNWSQEEMANKLAMSTNGYSKIERGETQVNFQKLEVIATIFGLDILELIAIGEEKRMIVLNSNNSTNSNCANFFGMDQDSGTVIHSLQMVIQHKDQLLDSKQREIDRLIEIIDLLKK